MPMKQTKIIEALGKLRDLINSRVETKPIRLTEEERALPVEDLSPEQVFNHIRFMTDEAEQMIRKDPDRREKVMRWLGNIQGCCWLLGLATIEEMKDMNRPDPEEELKTPDAFTRGRQDAWAGVAPRSSEPAYQIAYLGAKRAVSRAAESEPI